MPPTLGCTQSHAPAANGTGLPLSLTACMFRLAPAGSPTRCAQKRSPRQSNQSGFGFGFGSFVQHVVVFVGLAHGSQKPSVICCAPDG